LLTNSAGQILLVNQAMVNLFGFPPAEIIGQPIEALLPDEERLARKALRSIIHQAAFKSAANSVQRSEFTGQRKNGVRIPFEITVSPAGSDEILLVILRDIRRQQQQGHSLRKQTDLVHLLQEVAIASNEAHSVEAAFRFTVNRLCEYLDWPIGHALILDDNHMLLPMDIWEGLEQAQDQSFLQASQSQRYAAGQGLPGAVLASGQPVWLTDLNDSPLFLRSEAAQNSGLRSGLAIPVLAGRQVVGVLEFFHTDFIPPNPRLLAVLPHIGMQLGRVVERQRSETALRKSAANLQAIITNLPVILAMMDQSGLVTLVEGKGVSAAGIAPEKVLGQNIHDHQEQVALLYGLYQRALQGEETHLELSYDSHTFDCFFTPSYAKNHSIDGVILMALDATQRKQMEAELEEMKHRLLDSIDTEHTQIAQRLHDGPVQDLYGVYYQIQEISKDAAALPAAHKTVETVSETLQQVIATLQSVVSDLHPYTLVHLGLEKAILSYAQRAQGEGYGPVLHMDLDPDVRRMPYLTRLGIFRAYQEILDNALKHSHARHVWVRLRFLEKSLVLEVQDSGKGFVLPEHWIDWVRQGKFGLFAAQQRIQGLNGAFEVKTQPQAGVLVRATVPLPDLPSSE
jgi:PAS domain S-box-containing protein